MKMLNEEQVIKLLIEKMVDILSLKVCYECKFETPKHYNEKVYYHRQLTQEEYNQLKPYFLMYI